MKKYKNFLLLSATLLTSLSAPLAAANEQFSPSQLTAMTSEVSVQLEGQTAIVQYQPTAAQEAYTIQHAVWSEEGGQDDIKARPGLTCLSTRARANFSSRLISM